MTSKTPKVVLYTVLEQFYRWTLKKKRVKKESLTRKGKEILVIYFGGENKNKRTLSREWNKSIHFLGHYSVYSYYTRRLTSLRG